MSTNHVLAFLFLLALPYPINSSLSWKFDTGKEYIYKFDGLLLSSLATRLTDASQTRISGQVTIQAVDSKYLHLQLVGIEYASSFYPQHEKWTNISSLEYKNVLPTHKDLLQLPFRASIKNGLVRAIEFSIEDAEWSKNKKRAILNLISIRLTSSDHFNGSKLRFYESQNETTLEGDCNFTYIVEGDQKKENVTKFVEFDKCVNRPDIAYGYHLSTDCQSDQKNIRNITPRTKYTYTFENNQLQQSEIHSYYTLDIDGESVLKSETRSRLVLEEERLIQKKIKMVSGPQESLIYSTLNEMKLESFFKKGDEAEFNPFNQFSADMKVTKLRNLFEKIPLTNEQNTPETTYALAGAVRILRMLTGTELKTVHSKLYENSKKKIRVLIENMLAIAGTKNTIQHLIHHFEKGTISPLRAAELLKSIQETQYPSTDIADSLIELAYSPLAKQNEFLRQSTWLALGSVIRGFTSANQERHLTHEDQNQIKRKYLRVLMQEFENAENIYEKVLVLKALGNAGLNNSIRELGRIIHSSRQQLLIRIEAVEALRLLTNIMPNAIRKYLLPIYSNEHAPELRSAALWRLMKIMPNNSILGLIVAVMERESDQQVASFTYQVIYHYSKSTDPCHRKFAVRCSRALADTRYQPPPQLLAIFAQFPIFTSDILSVQFNFATMFKKNTYLPQKFQASLESVLMGNWNKYVVQFGFSQQNFEDAVLKSMEKLNEMSKIPQCPVEYGFQDDEPIQSTNPYATLYFRYKNMDYVFILIDMETIDNLLQYVKNEQIDMKYLHSFFNRDFEFEFHRAVSFLEITNKIPTTMGVPLTISSKMATVLSVNGEIKFKYEKFKTGITFDTTTSVASTLVTSMLFWSPMFETSALSRQTSNVYTPLKIGTIVEVKPNLKVSWKMVVPVEMSGYLNFGRVEKASPSEATFDKIFDLKVPQFASRRDQLYKMIRTYQNGDGFKQTTTLAINTPKDFKKTYVLKTVYNNDARMCKWKFSDNSKTVN